MNRRDIQQNWRPGGKADCAVYSELDDVKSACCIAVLLKQPQQPSAACTTRNSDAMLIKRWKRGRTALSPQLPGNEKLFFFVCAEKVLGAEVSLARRTSKEYLGVCFVVMPNLNATRPVEPYAEHALRPTHDEEKLEVLCRLSFPPNPHLFCAALRQNVGSSPSSALHVDYMKPVIHGPAPESRPDMFTDRLQTRLPVNNLDSLKLRLDGNGREATESGQFGQHTGIDELLVDWLSLSGEREQLPDDG
eukprot:111884-Amphidinium_carterae.1